MTGWLVKLHMHHAEDFDVFECEMLRPRNRGGVGVRPRQNLRQRGVCAKVVQAYRARIIGDVRVTAYLKITSEVRSPTTITIYGALGTTNLSKDLHTGGESKER